MRRSLHAEWIKLRTARMPWGLFAAGVLLTVLVLLLVGFTAGTRQGKATLPSLGTLAGQGQLFTSTQFALLLSLVLGVLVAAGVATGSLIRSQIGAIVIALVWCLGVEASLSAVVPACAPYLPYTAVLALAGQSSLAGGVSSLAFPAAFFLVAGVITVLAALASRTTLLRDIT